MNINDPAVINVLHRSMIARIATLSRTGRPSINPLYFIYLDDHLWLSTADWTLAARNVKADPRVSVLFEVEQSHADHQVLRISGRASVRTDQEVQLSSNLQFMHKYILTPGGILNFVTHVHLLHAMRSYHAQSAEKGLACVIEVIPEQIEFLNGGVHG
ncbi:MAG: pyridoxamine 5'-phosphate oxidase family protein [Ktedonobacteraceae bacterium]|nr:pyridoxamine 5'-phosphate oxidase family protein [Ktedonobacteraceae bacterium]